jgi:5'-nucleotidase
MHILVTNDDGVHAPGLLALAETMRQCGDVSIVAPDPDWSGGGHVKPCTGHCVCKKSP